MTTKRHIKRIMIGVAGGTILAIGIVLIVLPGPAFIVIPAGLAILAVEFAWARRWMRSARVLLPRPGNGAGHPRKKFSLRSARRGAGFLLRQVRRTLFPKRKTT